MNVIRNTDNRRLTRPSPYGVITVFGPVVASVAVEGIVNYIGDSGVKFIGDGIRDIINNYQPGTITDRFGTEQGGYGLPDTGSILGHKRGPFPDTPPPEDIAMQDVLAIENGTRGPSNRRIRKMKVSRKVGKKSFRRKPKGGIRKKNRKARKLPFKKRTKRNRRSRVNKNPKHAILKTVRYGEVVTSTTTAFVGHASCLVTEMLYLLIASFLKRLTMEMKQPMLNVLDNFGAETEVGSVVRLTTKQNVESGASVSYNDVVLGLTSTYESVIAAMASVVQTTNDQLQFLEIRYIPKGFYTGATTASGPSAGETRVCLEGSRFHFHSLSEFKMQNRTVSIVGDREADNVTNCPLMCKVYDGTGTGTTQKAGTPGLSGYNLGNSIAFAANGTTGIIAALGGTIEQFNTPPPKSYFPNVNKVSAAGISPGEIKLSLISTKRSFSMAQFSQKVFGDALSATGRKIKPLGKFRMFGIQKFMDPTAEGVISIAMEIKTIQTAWLTLNSNVVTAPINRQSIVTAIGP